MNDMKATDALYGFVAWLTTRKQVTKIGSSEGCSKISNLLQLYIETNDLGDPSKDYPHNLRFPKED